MRKVLFIVFLIPVMVFGQPVSENFEDGIPVRWIQYPCGRWSADTISPLSGYYSLHHSFDNTEPGTDRIAFDLNGLKPSDSVTVWKFSIRHAYKPSQNNNWAFFLMSDRGPSDMLPGNSVSGYALGVNIESKNDSLCLCKLVEGGPVVILKTSVNWEEDIGVDSVATLIVRRNIEGFWQVSIMNEDNEEVTVGETYDPDLFNCWWAGIMYRYTSSQDCKLWIDDISISGHFEPDRTAPDIDTVYFTGKGAIHLEFDELLYESPGPEQFKLMPGDHSPDEVISNGSSYDLYFTEVFENKNYYSLYIKGLCDRYGNCCDRETDSIPLAFPSTGDLIITEIMPDPEPPVNLPACEYIEILNVSGFDMNFEDIQLVINDKTFVFPRFILHNGDYVIVSNETDISRFSGYGSVVNTDKQFSLSNEGGLIVLENYGNEMIHGIEYEEGWFANSLKADGGWSLEMIDTDFPFSGELNWSDSGDNRGGSPGMQNSVQGFNPDLSVPVINNIFPSDPCRIQIPFSESMDAGVTGEGRWNIDGFEITGSYFTGRLQREIELKLDDSLSEAVIYEIDIAAEMTDMAGNILVMNDNRFGLPLMTGYSDLVINEILFDPLPGGAEFIELYNRSGKIIDLYDHFIVSCNTETSDTGKIIWLSSFHRCLMPGGYYVITDGREAVINSYTSSQPQNITELSSIPSLPDKSGSLLLFNRSMDLVDKTEYYADMHFSLLSVTGGVSLERIDSFLPGTDHANWRSASAMSGYATPGLPNSCGNYGDISSGSATMKLSSRKISPDNDGFEDFLIIEIDLPSDENILELYIFNDMGYNVRKLAENKTAGYNSKIIWDGCDNNGNLLTEGIYIIWLKVISPEGRTPEVFKDVCALVY